MYEKYNKKILFIMVIIIFIFSIAVIPNTYTKGTMYIMGSCIILLSCYQVYEYRDNLALAIVFFYMAYSNYSIVIGVYFFPSLRPNTLYSQINDNVIYQKALISLLIFEVVLFISSVLKRKKNTFQYFKIYIEKNRKNEMINIICMIIYIFMFFSTFSFQQNARASSSPLGEYRFIVLIIGAAYSNRKKMNKYMWAGIIAVTSLLELYGGNRVGILPGIVIFLLVWCKKYKLKKIFPIIFIGLIIFKMVGSMRQEFLLSSTGIWNAVKSLPEEKLTVDTFIYSFLPGILSLAKSAIDSMTDKIMLLANNIVYIFRGGYYKEFLLMAYTRKYYMHYYGFPAPLYLNYWFNYIGPVIAALIIEFHIKLVDERYLKGSYQNQLKDCISLLFVATVARWYSYNLLSLFRAEIILIVAFYIFKIIDIAMLNLGKWIFYDK